MNEMSIAAHEDRGPKAATDRARCPAFGRVTWIKFMESEVNVPGKLQALSCRPSEQRKVLVEVCPAEQKQFSRTNEVPKTSGSGDGAAKKG